ncbi:MAG: Zn-ribbon domain-containing OB-fold protein [Acidimicrobiia bacterium]
MSDAWEPMLLPVPDPHSRFFWESGSDGVLRMLRCAGCGFWIHPPAPVCTECLSRDVTPQPLSGRGIVHSFTVNHQQWSPEQLVPYVIVLVELAEQPGLRLTSSLVEIDPVAASSLVVPDPVPAHPTTVTIGLPVRVLFTERSGVFVPLFTPVTPAT